MGHFKTFTKGVVLGGIVGAIWGLFSAPKKGKELKAEASKKVKELIKKGKQLERKVEPKVRRTIKNADKARKKAMKESKKIVSKAKKLAKKYRR